MRHEAEIPDVTPDLPSRTWRSILAALSRLPQAGLSRAFGRIADISLTPMMRATVLGTFARAVGINVAEAEKPIEEYTSLNDFFVRRLAPRVPRRPRAHHVEVGARRRGPALQPSDLLYGVATP